MRVLIVALALVATPFVAGVSQGRGHDAAHCARRADQHPGKDINKCDPAPTPDPVPAPGASCAVMSGSTGTGSVTGVDYLDAVWSTLPDHCIEVSLDGVVVARGMTDATGRYRLAGLGSGNYTICEVSGWTVTWPTSAAACAGGLGWLTSVSDGMVSAGLDFAVKQ